MRLGPREYNKKWPNRSWSRWTASSPASSTPSWSDPPVRRPSQTAAGPDRPALLKAALTTDGLYLLQSGMTAQGYFDETGRSLQKSQLVGLDADGQPLESSRPRSVWPRH